VSEATFSCCLPTHTVITGRSGLSDPSSHSSPQLISSGIDIGPIVSGDESEEEFLYPGATDEPENGNEQASSAPVPKSHPSQAQLEALYAAASSGDFLLLQRLFRSAFEYGEVEAFALANDASSRTGFTALHAAASRGYINIVKWCKPPCFRKSVSAYVEYLSQWLRNVVLCPTWRIKRERSVDSIPAFLAHADLSQ
jgi:hypothetical protein